MTESQYALFLSIGAWLCAFAAVANLLNLKRRGNAAFILSAAFLIMGAMLWMIKSGMNQTLTTVAGVALVAQHVADFAIKSRSQQDKPQ